MTNNSKVFHAIRTIQQAEGEHPASWNTVRDYFMGMVRKQFRGKLRSKLDESDIVQESLLDVSRGARGIQGESPAEIDHWLKQLLKRNVVDATRRYVDASCRSVDNETRLSTQASAEIIDPIASTASSIFVRGETDVELLRAMASLTAEELQLLEYRHKLNWTFPQIGNRLGISEQAARKRWNRIIETLRKAMTARE